MANGSLIPWGRGSLTSGGSFGTGSLFDLHRQVNRLFENLFDRDMPLGGSMTGSLAPALDLHTDDQRVEITAELPGVKEEDIAISVENGVLTLTGEKRSERTGDYGYSERSYGRFERSLTLPADVDEDRASAEFRDGVLRISFPRDEAKSRGRRIPIGSATQPAQLTAQNDAEAAPRQQVAEEPARASQPQQQS
jgi:HSP20 family protein